MTKNFQHHGFIVVISSPSGCGKTTLSQMLLKKDSNLKRSISVTTRARRKGERDKRDYFFITEEKYKNMISKDLLLEHAEVFGNYYGTPKQYVEELIKQGKDVVCVIDWQGGVNLMKKVKNNIVSLFILPPSLSALKRRLMTRDTDTIEVINNRLSKAKYEISKCVHYDYIVINDKLDKCADEVLTIIRAERLKRVRCNVNSLLNFIERK